MNTTEMVTVNANSQKLIALGSSARMSLSNCSNVRDCYYSFTSEVQGHIFEVGDALVGVTQDIYITNIDPNRPVVVAVTKG